MRPSQQVRPLIWAGRHPGGFEIRLAYFSHGKGQAVYNIFNLTYSFRRLAARKDRLCSPALSSKVSCSYRVIATGCCTCTRTRTVLASFKMVGAFRDFARARTRGRSFYRERIGRSIFRRPFGLFIVHEKSPLSTQFLLGLSHWKVMCKRMSELLRDMAATRPGQVALALVLIAMRECHGDAAMIGSASVQSRATAAALGNSLIPVDNAAPCHRS